MNNQIQAEKKVRVKAKLNHITYPKSGQTSGTWTIALFNLLEILEGDFPIELEWKNQFVAKGKMPALNTTDTYMISAFVIEDEKYGLQLEVESMCVDYNLDDIEEQRKFFSFFLTPNQVEILYSQFEDPMKLLKEKDIDSLIKAKGIGPVTAQRMISKYEDCQDKGLAYVRFYDLGLTKGAIDKLVKFYGSPEAAVAVIENNPYTLIIQVPGYGWNKADAIALAQGLTLDCPERMGAYLVHYLREQAEINGNSWVNVDDLCLAVEQVCGPTEQEKVYEVVRRGIRDKTLYFDNIDGRIGLTEYRRLEENLADEIVRIQNGSAAIPIDERKAKEVLAKVEKEQGFGFTEEQNAAIWNTLNSQFSILTGAAGCVDCDTEFFNGERWKKIADYQEGEKVLQYNPETKTAQLATPLKYIKQECEEFWHIQSRIFDQCVSDDHLMVYHRSRTDNLITEPAETFVPKIQKGYHCTTPSGFFFDGPGIDLTDEQIELMCAVICDGSLMFTTGKRCRFHLKKERKKERLVDICQRANVAVVSSPSASEGYTDFYITAPLRTKEFTAEWYSCSQHQLQLIANNIRFWDGHEYKNGSSNFSSNVKTNADFIQFVFASTGHRSSIYTLNRSGEQYLTNGKTYTRKSVDFRVNYATSSKVPYPYAKDKGTAITRVSSTDGYKYCFTLPTSYWVSRRNGKISILHNCGKSSTVNGIAHVLREHNYRVAQVSLSGRAASKLTEITHIPGQTIHRLLGYDPENGRFFHDEENPVPYDIIIGDEVSMWGGEITLDLLRAVPNGAKVLFIGDPKQLEAIGLASVLTDTIKSQTIPTVQLTKIQRQKADSGIITQSLKVACGEQIVSANSTGTEYRGALRDFKLVTYIDAGLTQSKIIDEFNELYKEKGVPAKDIQVLVPMRSKGEASCRALNIAIQEIVNGCPQRNEVTINYADGNFKYCYTYRKNDRVIIMKNNYKTINTEGHKEPIFNGNVGYIKEIGPDYMIINLTEQGDIILTEDNYDNLSLAYAITVHKKQGDSSPYVIGAIDSSSYALISKELLYTMITRARKYCVIVGQKRILQQAVKISRVKTKQTWLKELLQAKEAAKAAKENIYG